MNAEPLPPERLREIRARLDEARGLPVTGLAMLCLLDGDLPDLLDALETAERAHRCQFSDAEHLEHRPFTERAPICWDCHQSIVNELVAAAETAEQERDALKAVLPSLISFALDGPTNGASRNARDAAVDRAFRALAPTQPEGGSDAPERRS